MNEFQNQNRTYREMSAQRANMTWPERQEQLELQKLAMLKAVLTELSDIKRLLSEKAAGKPADKSGPTPTQAQSR